MKTRILIIIVVVVCGTFFGMTVSGGAVSYVYNKSWLANDNEIPECLLYASVTLDCAENSEYLNGLFWWSNIVSFGILGAGLASCIMLWKKRIVVK